MQENANLHVGEESKSTFWENQPKTNKSPKSTRTFVLGFGSPSSRRGTGLWVVRVRRATTVPRVQKCAAVGERNGAKGEASLSSLANEGAGVRRRADVTAPKLCVFERPGKRRSGVRRRAAEAAPGTSVFEPPASGGAPRKPSTHPQNRMRC